MDWDWDKNIYSTALTSLYIMCPLTFFSLYFVTAPYGKHARSGGGLSFSPAIAWSLMESPTLWLTFILYPLGRHHHHPLSLAVISLYLLHYLHRTIIYPLRLLTSKQSSTRVPLAIVLAAFSFNLLNAYLQARSASHFADYPEPTAAGLGLWVRVGFGSVVFFFGMWANVTSDLVLVRLKRECGGGYKIPRGGWFELVSCPNYMGEVVEWLGWAIVAWSPAGFAFFLYTFSNLVPRAAAHHNWYLDKFRDEYPRSRRAVIPFVY